MRFQSVLTAGVLGALALLTGCGGGGGSGGLGGGGGTAPTGNRLRVYVTDAPFPFDYVESASVVIKEVRVHEKNSDAWTTVFEGSSEIDLVPLQNGLTQLLVDAAIEPGTYDQVRLIVDSGEVVLSEDAVVKDDDPVFNSEKGNLFFPSGAQTGIKLHVENDIVVTTQLSGDLILDFDLSRNFVFNGPVTHAPGVQRVLFTPSVRATNASVAGSLQLRALSDQLTPLDPTDDVPLEGATVRVFTDGSDPAVDVPVATGATGVDGIAVISALPPGNYMVVVEATNHEPETVGGIVIVVANLTDVGDVLLAATGEVSGTVMSDAATPAVTTDDVVVAGATVEIRAAGDATLITSTTTDLNGSFQFTGLSSGSYDLTVIATGYVTQTVSAVPATISGPGVTILLQALTATVQGTVTDDATGDPISGATVVVTNVMGVEVASTATAADGTYSVVLGTGDYTFTFTGGGSTIQVLQSVTGADPAPTITLDQTL